MIRRALNLHWYELLILFTSVMAMAVNLNVLYRSPQWDLSSLPVSRAGLLLVFLFTVTVASWVRSRARDRNIWWPVWLTPISIFSIFLSLGHDHLATVKFLLFLFACGLYLASFRAARFLKKANLLSLLVIAFVVLHTELFLLMIAHLLDAKFISAIFVVHLTLGAVQLRKMPWLKTVPADDSMSFQLLLCSLSALLCLSFMTGLLPQTMADGVVYRLPTLAQMAVEHQWPFHDYLWIRLIPQPFILLLFPGYLAFGEIAASSFAWLFSLLCAYSIYELTRQYSKQPFTALLAAVLFLVTPPYWILTTSIFNDIALVFFSLAGIALIKKSCNDSSKINWYAGWSSLGLAAAVKLNAPLIFLPTLAAILFFERAKLRDRLQINSIVGIVIAGGLTLFPWLAFVANLTGNPLFPFLERVFPNKMGPVEVLNPQSMIQFHFDLNPISILRLPVDITYATNRFGEYLDGTLGIVLISLTAGALTLALAKRLRGTWSAFTELVMPGLIAFLLIALTIHMGNLRYWITGFALTEIGLLVVLESGISRLAEKTFAALIIPLSFCFLLVFGVRLNYEVPDGLGGRVYFGQQQRTEWLWDIAYGIPDFVNRNAAASDEVFSTAFQFVHLFKPKTYYVSSQLSLLGNITTPEKLEHFIRDHNIRFWITDAVNPPAFLKDIGAGEIYFRPSNLVYGGGRFAVYDLRKEIGTPLLTTKLVSDANVQTSARQRWVRPLPLDPQANVVRLKANLSIPSAPTHAIFELIFFKDNGKSEISRSVVSAAPTNVGETTLSLISGLPPGTASAEIAVRTWLEQDPALHVQSIEISEYGSL